MSYLHLEGLRPQARSGLTENMAGSEQSFSSQLDRVRRLKPDKRVANSSVSRAAEISLQPAAFGPDDRGEKSPLDRVEG